MPYAYPSTRTGTAQDLFRVVTRACELELERNGTILPSKTEFQRRWVEPVFRGAGIALAKFVETWPADWAVAFHERIWTALAAPRSYPFDPASPFLARARSLAARLERDSGAEPALLALLSHPPVMGDLAHLNYELFRHATLALRAVRGRLCRPRMVAAIDPFGLDGSSIVVEGLYAGSMGAYHIGLDRLALGRAHPGPRMSPQASWTAMPHRLFRALAGGAEIGLVLSGGVPATARTLYGVREWIRGARRRSPARSHPAEVARLLKADASFTRFERALAAMPAAERIHVPPGTWRKIDAWLMCAAADLLPGETVEAAAAAALRCLGVPEAERPDLLANLALNLARETPQRRRLFQVLCGRVARRRPLLIVPVTHGTAPLGVSSGEAWSLEHLASGRIRARRGDAPDAPIVTTPESFADRFVGDGFR